MKSKSHFREYAIVVFLLGLAIILFWWRAWIPSPLDRMHFTDDIYVKDYPTRLGLFRILLSGHLPLWDPYQFGGWPGIANCEAGFFYPLNWILIPFVYSPKMAFAVTEWLVLLHFFIAGLGAYRLARYTGLSIYGSGLAAIAFAFCGFHCAHKKHTNMLFTLVWFPWVLLQAERWIQEYKSRYLIRTILILALALFAGHPQSSLYITIILFARLLYAGLSSIQGQSIDRNFVLKRCIPIVFIIVLASSLTAVQWIPSWELIQEGERAAADQFRRSTEFSLPTYELIDIFMPEALRTWSQVEVYYWGIIPLVLALLTVVQGSLDSLQRFLVGTAIISVLLSMGEHIFVYDLSYILVPGVAWVRAPSRWIYFASLPIAITAGKGIDTLLADPAFLRDRESSMVFRRIILMTTAVLGLFLYFIFLVARTDERFDLLRAMILLVMFAGTFLTFIILTQQKKISPAVTAFLAILLTWLDLGTHYRTLDMAPGSGGYEMNQVVQQVHQLPEGTRTKVYLNSGGNRTRFHGSAQNFRELDGQSPLTPRVHLQLRKDSAVDNPAKLNFSLMNLCSVGTIITEATGFPLELNREGEDLVLLDPSPVRTRLLPEIANVNVSEQRKLLTLQSFPFDRVAINSLAEQEFDEAESTALPTRAVFSKPFLLASTSNEAVEPAAHLIVNGKDHFADLTDVAAGYYIAFADPDTGKIKEAKAFNLMEGFQKSSEPQKEGGPLEEEQYPIHQQMLNFIAAVPAGDVVFVAIKDNATNVLLPKGLAALRSIGSALDVRDNDFYRYAHAVVGKKGAPLGTALEIVSPTEALVLQTNRNIYVQGTAMGPPKPYLEATTKDSNDWFQLFSKLSPSSLPQYRFKREHQKAAGFPLPYPITVYSVPKKTIYTPIVDQARIFIGGKDISQNNPGYNMAILNPETGEVEANGSFNISSDYDPSRNAVKKIPTENIRMQNFIRSASEGHVVVGAIRDEATSLLQPETVDALRLVGSEITISATAEMRYRLSHAFVGIKGASRCVEAFEIEKNAIVYTRYPGGPTLTDVDRTTQESQYPPPEPMEELMQEAKDTSWTTDFPKGEVWVVEEKGPNELHISGTSETGGMLFLSEIMYPGWTAWVDGVPAPIHRTNYYFRGIRIPAGAHEIKMVYSPSSFYMGMWISIAAVFIIFIWGVLIKKELRG